MPTLSEVDPDSIPKSGFDSVEAEGDGDTVKITYSSFESWQGVLATPFIGIPIAESPGPAVQDIIDAADGRLISKLEIIGHGFPGDQTFVESGGLTSIHESAEMMTALTRLGEHFASGAEVELQGCLVANGYAGALLLDDLAYVWRDRSVIVKAGTSFQQPFLPGWEGHIHARQYYRGQGRWFDVFGSVERIRRWFYPKAWATGWARGGDIAADLEAHVATARNKDIATSRYFQFMYGIKEKNDIDNAAQRRRLGKGIVDLLENVDVRESEALLVDYFGQRPVVAAEAEGTSSWDEITSGMASEDVSRFRQVLSLAESTFHQRDTCVRGEDCGYSATNVSPEGEFCDRCSGGNICQSGNICAAPPAADSCEDGNVCEFAFDRSDSTGSLFFRARRNLVPHGVSQHRTETWFLDLERGAWEMLFDIDSSSSASDSVLQIGEVSIQCGDRSAISLRPEVGAREFTVDVPCSSSEVPRLFVDIESRGVDRYGLAAAATLNF